MREIEREGIRELTIDETDEVAGGYLNFYAKNQGIGSVNVGYRAGGSDNISVGIGQVNV